MEDISLANSDQPLNNPIPEQPQIPQPIFEENKEPEYVFIGQNQGAEDTSETSSYKSSDNEIEENADNNQEMKEKKEKHIKQVHIDEDKIMLGDGDEFEEPSTVSYAKFKSQNEVDPEQAEKFAPKMPLLDDLDDLVPFGKCVQFIQQASGMLLVSPKDVNQIYDLDNIVATRNRQVLGFIVDVVGPVNQPLYSVQIYHEYAVKNEGQDIKDVFMQEEVFLLKKCLKVITSKLPQIMNKKGCDASNFFDEELSEKEQEFSDDDKEREYKKAKKLAKKSKNFEEGEIPQPKKRKNGNNKPPEGKFNNKRFKEHSYSRGSQIPMYSTNFSVTQQQPLIDQTFRPPQPRYPMQQMPYQDPYQQQQMQQQFMQQPQYYMPQMQQPYQQYPPPSQMQQQFGYFAPFPYPQYNPVQQNFGPNQNQSQNNNPNNQ